MKLTIGFSPCPNDTFIFDALVNKKIDTEGLEWEVQMEDVQTLNERAIKGQPDICKISYGVLPLILDTYTVLNAGSALGKGVGPLLISRIPIPEPAIKQCVIAIPGQNTTANVLFSLAFPEATNKVFLRFDEIEDFVTNGSDSLENIHTVKLGVIIHENRFTYEDKGLVKLLDLGDFWEKETSFPIPLGGIVVRRSLASGLQKKIDRLIRASIEYAFSNYPEINDFIKDNALEMKDEIIRKHIDLYVNNYSLELGEDGKMAVKKFLNVHSAINKIPMNSKSIFL
jgi:1,4-dihydroxy-6-naphthoate synthase